MLIPYAHTLCSYPMLIPYDHTLCSYKLHLSSLVALFSVRTVQPFASIRAPVCPALFTTLHVGFGGICMWYIFYQPIQSNQSF